jgi:hypothetical protein
MMVIIMNILKTIGIYNMVIWTTKSWSCSQLQMAFMTSFVVINVVVNATFWCCDVHPPTCYLFVCFTIVPTHLLHVCLHHHRCPPILPLSPTCLLHVLSLACCLTTYFAIIAHSPIACMFALSAYHHCLPTLPSLPCMLNTYLPCSCLL